MMFEIGESYLITTDQYFIAPDGQSYRAVFGVLNGVMDAPETLGIKTNRNATNWYVSIGNMVLAGCQVHYAIQTDEADGLAKHISEGDGKEYEAGSRIYIAPRPKRNHLEEL